MIRTILLLASVALLAASCAGNGPSRVAKSDERRPCPLEDFSVTCVRDNSTGTYYRL